MTIQSSRTLKDDYRDFIILLNKYKVDYCIIGAYAFSFHAEPRSTSDIDFYIAHTLENSKRVAAALKEFADSDVDPAYFDTSETVIMRIGFEPNQIELCNGLTGLSDEEIMHHRIKGEYGDVVAYFIGLDELLKNKKILKDLPRRGRKQSSDASDYATLKIVKEQKNIRGDR